MKKRQKNVKRVNKVNNNKKVGDFLSFLPTVKKFIFHSKAVFYIPGMIRYQIITQIIPFNSSFSLKIVQMVYFISV